MKSHSKPLLALICFGLSSFASAETNIVLVITDDQGYGDASANWPQTDLETPVFDRIAADGIRFTQFRVNPLCAPTRASIMTGTHNIYNGMWRGPGGPKTGPDGVILKPETRVVHDDVRMLPEFLKKAGYATGLFGKWHLGYDPDNVPNTRGFDAFVGFPGGAHPYRWSKNSKVERNGAPLKSEKHYTDLFADEAIRFIKENKDRPFFCTLAFNAVHGPLRSEKRAADSARPDWLQTYADKGVPQPRRDYNAVMSHADDRVGDVLETLDALGLAENTLVIYLSDNGGMTHTYPSNNGPLRGGKGEGWEGGLRVPAVMQWPGTIPPNSLSRASGVHFDLFATILDVAGTEIPDTNGRIPMDGVSLLPHLKSGGKAALPDRVLFFDLWGKQAAIHGPWKIVADTGNHHGKFEQAVASAKSADYMLVNLDNDLGETTDLKDAHPEIYADLKARFIAWLEKAIEYN